MGKTEQNFMAKTSPLPHQVDAINYIHKNDLVALFDEQGLGKTKIVIDALSIDMSKGKIEGVLVVAPMTLLYNWEQEVLKHSFLIPIVLRGSRREKRYKFLTGANFYITNYESTISELQRIERFCKSRVISIVLDESSRIKDPKSQTAQAIFKLGHLSHKKIIISGTPIANKPYDLWAQYYFLDQGKLLGYNYNEFKAKFNLKNIDYKINLKNLRETINKNSIRRMKNDVLALPEKEYQTLYASLTGKQLEMYKKLSEELVVEIINSEGEIVLDESNVLLKKLLRLTQIASNPYLIDKNYDEIPSKILILDDLIDTLIIKGEKILVWTNFIENIILLKNRYKKYSPLAIYGNIPIKDRSEYIKAFQLTETNKIMILNPSAAREGITLTRANNAIYLDRNFNLVDYLQSQDRIHRISQDKKCMIYKIVAKGTIDEYIDNFVDVKKEIAGFLQSDVREIKEECFDFLLNKTEILRALGG
jgi:SNF2 family DNA or RNA helicase